LKGIQSSAASGDAFNPGPELRIIGIQRPSRA
jgi:hypothetical protein